MVCYGLVGATFQIVEVLQHVSYYSVLEYFTDLFFSLIKELNMSNDNNSSDKSQEEQMAAMPKVDDKCPDWAITVIDQLRQVEIILGNVPKAIEWQSDLLKDVNKKIFAEQAGPISDEHSELLFSRVARGLVKEGFSPDEISVFINARIGYKGGPQYCNADEVKDALD